MNQPRWMGEMSYSQVPNLVYNAFVKHRPPYVSAAANQILVCTDEQPITDDRLAECIQ